MRLPTITVVKCLLLVILILGTLLRLHNVTPFKIYPDSYQNLLVAHNLFTYQSVVGWLGDGGMVYPPFVAWSRFGYSALIAIGMNFFSDTAKVAQAIAVISSCASIPLAFIVGKRLFSSTGAGLATSFLLAVSFNHIVWSGFILTESLGVFVLLVLLWFITATPSYPEAIAFGSALLFACSTRYEYALLVLPLLWYVHFTRRWPVKYIATVLGICAFGGVLLFLSLFPIASTLRIMSEQFKPLVGMLAFLSCGSALGWIVWAKLSSERRSMISKTILTVFLGGVFLCSLLVVVEKIFPSIVVYVGGITSFIVDDILLWVMFGIGIYVLRGKEKYYTLGVFLLFSLLCLGGMYYLINKQMERYLTHLLPFMLPFAGVGLFTVATKLTTLYQAANFSRVYKIVTLVCILLVGTLGVYQIKVSWEGIRQWGDKTWFTDSYEDKSARKARSVLKNDNAILLTSMPEPYFFVMKRTTHSLTSTYPYIYLPNVADTSRVYILVDMGMRDLFPQFTSLVTKRLSKHKVTEYRVGTHYHYAHRSLPETHPVSVYETTVGNLRRLTSP